MKILVRVIEGGGGVVSPEFTNRSTPDEMNGRDGDEFEYKTTNFYFTPVTVNSIRTLIHTRSC